MQSLQELFRLWTRVRVVYRVQNFLKIAKKHFLTSNKWGKNDAIHLKPRVLLRFALIRFFDEAFAFVFLSLANAFDMRIVAGAVKVLAAVDAREAVRLATHQVLLHLIFTNALSTITAIEKHHSLSI